MATRHLLGLGHRRIGFIGDARTQPRVLLHLGPARWLPAGDDQAGLPMDPGLVRRARPGSAAAAELAADLLRQADRPTAIFAASDTQAVGVLSAADAAGLRVPGDLSVIGFDDIDTAVQWSLSTVRQPLRESGTRGAVRLGRLLRGEAVRPLREVLPLELIVRGSTSAARDRGTAGRAGPARPEPAGSRSRLSLARAL